MDPGLRRDDPVHIRRARDLQTLHTQTWQTQSIATGDPFGSELTP
jgi:hypothetical protein